MTRRLAIRCLRLTYILIISFGSMCAIYLWGWVAIFLLNLLRNWLGCCIFAFRNIGRSSVRGRAFIGIRLGLRTVNGDSRVATLHFGGRPNIFLAITVGLLKYSCAILAWAICIAYSCYG